MNTDSVSSPCPRCGVPIPPEAPGGLCPRCVLQGAATPTEGGSPARRLEAPAFDRVRAAFPQLEILELVGHGGMGFVYSARQRHLDRIVALKLLPLATGSDPTFAERFTREGRLLARLNHPNIVAVYDFGQTEGFCFLVMEFVDGVNLRQAMRSGRFSPREALAIVPHICEALQYAHEQGVLHRDIKPENILLDARGRVKIADFGIAKLVGDQATDFTLTASGARLGTPHYMAPEQIESPGEVDHRADIYSLGVVFYELLTGELPLGRFAVPSAKADLDARVDEIVLRALAKERELRQQTAGEVKTQVEAVTEDHPGSAESPRPSTSSPSAAPKETQVVATPGWRWKPEHQPFVMLAIVALLVLLSADLVSMLIGYGVAVSGLIQYGLFGVMMALSIAAGGVWLIRKAWQTRERLLEPLGLTNTGERSAKTLFQAGTALLMVLVVRLVFQGLVVGSALVIQIAEMVRSSGVLLIIILLGLVAFWLKFKDAWKSAGTTLPVPVSPPGVRRVGWWFLAFGLVSFIPTILSWGSSVRVWHPGSLLAVVGLAVLTQSRLWRSIALVVCSVLAVAGLWGLANIPMLIASVHAPDLRRGLNAAVSPAEVLVAAGQWLAFVGGLLFLNRKDVRATFGLEATAAQELAPNPWPHRLFWVILGPVLLVGSALIAGLLAPALQMSNGPVSGAAAGLIPLATGAMVAWLFWRTRPTPERAQPRSQWNPWPQRIFWAVVSVLLVPAFLLLVGLAVPRMLARVSPPSLQPALVNFHGIEPAAPPVPVLEGPVAGPTVSPQPEALLPEAAPVWVRLERAERVGDPERMTLVWIVQSDEPGRVKVGFRGRQPEVELSRTSDQNLFTARFSLMVEANIPRGSLGNVRLRVGDRPWDFDAPLKSTDLDQVLAEAESEAVRKLGADRSAVLTRVAGETLTLEFLEMSADFSPASDIFVSPTLVHLEQSERGTDPESARSVWRVQSDQPGRVTVRFRDSRAEVELARISEGVRFGARISLAAIARSPSEALVAVQLVAGDQQGRFDVPLNNSVPLDLDQVLTYTQLNERLPLLDSRPVALTQAAGDSLIVEFEHLPSQP